MVVANQQLHGYRHGHELLSSSVKLPSTDQDLIDRLSDVAGPLAPGERFAPYLTCYPLPSGTHYVVARTWLDESSFRAGCVRTRSLIVGSDDWGTMPSPAALAEAATAAGPSRPAERSVVNASAGIALPPVEESRAELLEAIFLEDRIPIAVFGAQRAELLALRIMTAVWPSFRRRLSVSTFCNSPRTISRRGFDLVFAPTQARSRFADWDGRRIDGRRETSPRHRWTGAIAERILKSDEPSLVGLDVLGGMNDGGDGEEALRVSLLWEDLRDRLPQSPHAALGLLDIANTRARRRDDAVRSLQPALIKAAGTAAGTMEAGEAWRFLTALFEKLGEGGGAATVAHAVATDAAELTGRDPGEAIRIVPSLLSAPAREPLIRAVGDALGRCAPEVLEGGLEALLPEDLLRLLVASPELASEVLDRLPRINGTLAPALVGADTDLRAEARSRLLPLMFADANREPMRALVADLDAAAVAAEIERLHGAGHLSSTQLTGVLVERARSQGGLELVRERVAALDADDGADRLLASLVSPSVPDVDWILCSRSLSPERRGLLLLGVLDHASTDQLRIVLADGHRRASAIEVLSRNFGEASDVLAKIADLVPMEGPQFLALVLLVLPSLKTRRASSLAARAVEVVLPRRLGADRSEILSRLLTAARRDVDASRAVRIGLGRGVEASVAGENIVALNAVPDIRARLVRDPELMADSLLTRQVLDLGYPAVEVVGRLLWDSSRVNWRGFLAAAARLLPFAMGQVDRPVSPLIAAVFPPIYKELQREWLPEFLLFVFIFIDWDRCKSARRELADAFGRSGWRSADIALAAARAEDLERIMARIVRSARGAQFLAEVRRDLSTIPAPWRQQVKRALSKLA